MKIYLVRNREGKFFRPVGRSGYGENWTSIDRAKIYPKVGPAKAIVVDLTSECKDKIAKKKALELKRDLEYKQYQKEMLEQERAEIEKKLKKL